MTHNELILAACIFSVPALLMLGVIRVLNDGRSWRVLIWAASLLAATGISLFMSSRMGAEGAVAAAAPLYQLLLFRLGYTVFVRHCRREPIDVAMVWQTGLALDRVFSISYFLLSVFVPLAIVSSLTWGTAK